MNSETIQEISDSAVENSYDHRLRRFIAILVVLCVLLLCTAIASGVIIASKWQSEAKRGASLARQLASECEIGAVPESQQYLCKNATKVIEGEAGAPGVPGASGRDGEDGLDGPPGTPGRNGRDGKDGRDGEDGEDGALGSVGLSGPKGDTGSKGDPGEKGEPGPKGDKGEPGPKGDKGEPGPKGDTGSKGDPGEKGEKGDAGPAMTSIEFDTTDALGVTTRYVCSDPDGDLVYTCEVV